MSPWVNLMLFGLKVNIIIEYPKSASNLHLHHNNSVQYVLPLIIVMGMKMDKNVLIILIKYL